MVMIEVDEKKLDKLLNAFGHNCDYLYEEAYGKYCCHGVLINEPQKCGNCQFKNSKSIKEWLRKENQH